MRSLIVKVHEFTEMMSLRKARNILLLFSKEFNERNKLVARQGQD